MIGNYNQEHANSSSSIDNEPLSDCGDRCQIGQVCRNHTCTTCLTDSECFSLNDQWVCQQGQCTHKSLFHSEVTFLDILGMVLLFIGCALSSGGGVGGGGIYIPILILVSKWDPKSSIPLSNCLVAGCSLANFIQNFPRRHPFSNKHLIDFSVALLIEPLTLAGTIFGVYLHTYFPPLVILLLLVITLGFTSFKTITKGVEIYRKEIKAKVSLLNNDHHKINDSNGSGSSNPNGDGANSNVKYNLLIFSTMFSIFKGGDEEYSLIGVKLCSPLYWVLSFVMVPVIIILWGFTARYLYREYEIRRDEGREIEGEIKYTHKNIIVLGILSIVAGILASLLGIGGGMIKGPVLLQMGLSPDVTAATSSYMILFTSASSAIQYILVGKLRWDYGIVYYAIGFISCFVGTQTLIWIVKKYQRRSYIVFLIGAVISVSTILLVVTESIDFVKYRNLSFDSICKPSGSIAS
ncbi:hypothetical protein DICPUDRAFT_89425 [Dictyostelium purpureum]|uniref:Uncharacterized protein n=1 Tax=Dictyostelium purpureum TaxID=5786 RepID=F0ZVQ5_DICPU|nr:uncharacterized protein DICPUDRAFT_89425 [Dictyostelium purpureum]EGC31962.1 hypothetical protein DICPUDRAFT_89425 [Dictyostelium purpureum]|eukprot:XP_003291498.1 hypothetical protein DICPUDRAFT_89425 [Dictyostelium purpureum]